MPNTKRPKNSPLVVLLVCLKTTVTKSFLLMHPKNSFVLVEWKDKHLLFEGKQSLALVDSPLSSLDPIVDSLEDCVKYLSSL